MRVAWVIWFLFSLLLSLFVAGKEGWRSFWPLGVVAPAVVYALDGTLIALGAFRYDGGLAALGGLPLFYFLATAPLAVVAARFYPADRRLRLPYVVALAAAFLLVEQVMLAIGSFAHLNWSPARSLALNVLGFSFLFWMGEWLGCWERDR